MKSIGTLMASLTAAVIVAGCASQEENQFVHVRFTSPVTLDDLDAHAYGFSGASVASYQGDAYRGGSSNRASTASSTSPQPVPQFESATRSAALWGGDYHGADVTFTQTPLSPGFYNFAYWDGAQNADLVGSIRVSSTSSDLAETFRRWKASLPAQRQRAAYGFEIEGKVANADTKQFDSLKKRLSAIDEFEKELDRAIDREMDRREAQEAQQRELLSTAVVHLFPGQGYHYADQAPAFAAADVTRANSGETVTKAVLVADHKQVQSRLRDVDRLGQKLSYLRDSLRDKVRRLEGAKALRSIVFRDHKAFTQNEERLRSAMEELDNVNERLGDLRSRRLALALTGELFSPNGGFAPLETEMALLDQERAVLSAELERANALFARSNAISPQRVQLERRRQRVQHAMNQIEQQSAFVADARSALAQMRDESAVVYRQGVMKLLAATTFNEQFPMSLRDAIEHEAVMVVRLQRRTTGGSSLANYSQGNSQSWTDANSPSSQPQSQQYSQSQKYDSQSNQPQSNQSQSNQSQPKAQPASYSPAQPMIEMQPE